MFNSSKFKDVFREYQVRFPGETTLDQCACLYVRAGLVAHLWSVGNRSESQKKKILKKDFYMCLVPVNMGHLKIGS